MARKSHRRCQAPPRSSMTNNNTKATKQKNPDHSILSSSGDWVIPTNLHENATQVHGLQSHPSMAGAPMTSIHRAWYFFKRKMSYGTCKLMTSEGEDKMSQCIEKTHFKSMILTSRMLRLHSWIIH
eukprot:scaffold34360_cov177-Skeletonema_menzelii.AAC.1